MSINLRRIGSVAWAFLRIALLSGAVGAGIGVLQGDIVSRLATREEQMAFAEGAATIGALAAMIVGTVAYFVIKGDVSLKQFSTTAFWVICVGSVVAFFPQSELVTVFADVLTAIIVAAYQFGRRKTVQS
jgi:hypothetical protein